MSSKNKSSKVEPKKKGEIVIAEKYLALPVVLTDKQRLETIESLTTISGLEEEEKRALPILMEQVKGRKSKIGGYQARITEICKSLREGEKITDVKVKIVPGAKPQTVKVVRIDTGEVVEIRPATEEELQMDWVEELGGKKNPESKVRVIKADDKLPEGLSQESFGPGEAPAASPEWN